MAQSNVDRFYRELGEKIREKRLKVPNISQINLGKIIGMSRTSVVNIEKGRQRIQIHTLCQIAQVLSINPADLIPNFVSDINVLPSEVKSQLRPGEITFVASILNTIKEDNVNANSRHRKKSKKSVE